MSRRKPRKKTSRNTLIERYVIDQAIDRRKTLRLSQADLAKELNVGLGFIGSVESNRFDEKYSLNHINKIAKILNCSPRDFLPEQPL